MPTCDSAPYCSSEHRGNRAVLASNHTPYPTRSDLVRSPLIRYARSYFVSPWRLPLSLSLSSSLLCSALLFNPPLSPVFLPHPLGAWKSRILSVLSSMRRCSRVFQETNREADGCSTYPILILCRAVRSRQLPAILRGQIAALSSKQTHRGYSVVRCSALLYRAQPSCSLLPTPFLFRLSVLPCAVISFTLLYPHSSVSRLLSTLPSHPAHVLLISYSSPPHALAAAAPTAPVGGGVGTALDLL
jgi:hypothetical protein